MWMYDFLIFYNGGNALLNGFSPYSVEGFISPIYLAIFFAPLSIFHPQIAYNIFIAANIFFAGFLLRKKLIWAFLFFPFLYSLFVGQIDFLITSLITVGSPWTIALALVKPQLAFVVVPWMVVSFKKEDWKKAILSTGIFVGLGFLIQPNWLVEWLSLNSEFTFYSSHASNVYWLIPLTNLDIRAKITIIGSLLILPIGLFLKNRVVSWTTLHIFAPLTNIYSPTVLLEWIGPIECLLSWVAVLLVRGNIFTGMPLFLVGASILIRRRFESILEHTDNN